MAYIYYRRLGTPSMKKNWVPPNRKYKWLFWMHIIIDIALIVKILTQVKV